MIIYNVLYVFASIGIFVIAMQCCWKKVSASQFTLYMTIGNLGRVAAVSLIGPIKGNFGWEISLLAFAAMIAMAWFILQFLNIDRQVEQVTGLEKKEVESNELVLAPN